MIFKRTIRTLSTNARAGASKAGNGRPAVGVYPNVNRKRLAKKVGMSEVQVGRVLGGRSKGTGETLKRLAEGMGVEVGELARRLEERAQRNEQN